MDQVFENALFYSPPNVLDKQLLPFSLGHYALLELVESPIIHNQKIGIGDIALLATICSLPYKEAKELLSFFANNDDKSLKRNWAIFKYKNWCRNVNLRTEQDIINAYNKVNEYLIHYTTAPKTWTDPKATKTAKAPWCYTISVTIMKELGFDEDKVWDMPLNKALSYYATIGEQNGVEIRNDHEVPQTPRKMTPEEKAKIKQLNKKKK